MPKKALVRSIEIWNSIQRAEEFGASVSDSKLDWKKVVSRKNTIIDKFTSGKEPQLKKLGVDFVRGHAKFSSPTTIIVGEEEYSADRFLIGTGSVPSIPKITGIELAITNKDILNLSELPESLIIIGGGVISLEFAYVFASAGVDVTIILRSHTLLSSMDKETSEMVLDITRSRGITVLTEVQTHTIRAKEDHGYVLEGEINGEMVDVEADLILNATGRTPAVNNLGLENAGVEFSSKGIVVNEYFETSTSGIYAAGDVIGGLMLTPIATYEAKIAIRNAIKGTQEMADYSVVPHVIFTSPPIASIGLSEEMALERGVDFDVHKSFLKNSGVAILLGEEEGYMKILTETDTGRIIGFQMVGIHADEIVHSMGIALRAKFTIHDLSEVMNVHPTISETLTLMAGNAVKKIKS